MDHWRFLKGASLSLPVLLSDKLTISCACRLVQYRLQNGRLNGPSVALGNVRIGQGVEVEMD